MHSNVAAETTVKAALDYSSRLTGTNALNADNMVMQILALNVILCYY